MEFPPSRVHLYHADATALGGNLVRPIETLIETKAPVSLAPVGGYAAASASKFRLENIISFESAKTQVSGSRNPASGGATTLVTASVDLLNVQDVVTADKLVAQISTEHPLEGYEPKVNFIGTKFVNLRIAGELVELDVDLDICSPDGDVYPKNPCLHDDRFAGKVEQQYGNTANSKGAPQWIKDRYKWHSATHLIDRGFALCSVVRKASGGYPGLTCGNVIIVPNFGRIFLGELSVHRTAFQLSMIRFELGSPVEGDISAVTAKSNGRGSP